MGKMIAGSLLQWNKTKSFTLYIGDNWGYSVGYSHSAGIQMEYNTFFYLWNKIS